MICPYCFEPFEPSKILFRCINPICAVENDAAKANYYGKDEMMEQKAFIPTGFKGKDHADCPACKKTTYKALCPHCHNDLPASFMSAEHVIISLVGTRDSGKSTFIGVLIHELIRRIAPRLGATFTMSPDDQKEYVRRYGSILYPEEYGSTDSPRILDQTRSNLRRGVMTLIRPIVGNLQMGKKLISLVFFDAAGEDFEDQGAQEIALRYMGYSNAVVLLIDPFIISAISNEIKNSTNAEYSSNIDRLSVAQPDIVVGNIATTIRHLVKKSNGAIPIPFAAVLGKLDVMPQEILAKTKLLSPSTHLMAKRYSDKDEFARVNNDVKSLVHHYQMGHVDGAIQQNFSNSKYFAVSAIGNHPDRGGGIPIPQPMRLEDPILWIFTQLGILKR